MNLNKEEFHASKQPIALELLDINQTVTSKKFKDSDKVSKYCIGYKYDDGIIRLFCIILS